MLSVVLRGRESFARDAGGDTVQTLKYREHLARTGACQVRLDLQPAADLSRAQIVHCFNLQVAGQTHRQILEAKRQGKKVVFSPIYWTMDEYRRHRRSQARELGTTPWREALRNRYDAHWQAFSAWRAGQDAGALALLARLTVRGKLGLQRESLALADLILVSAPSERDRLCRDFAMAPDKVRILPNGVEAEFAHGDPASFAAQYGGGDFLLAVGRLEPHKNQLGVLRAIRELPVRTVCIGSQRDPRYLELCRRAARPDTLFLNALPHEVLPSAYAAARAHILASWFDIPGLVSLEASAAGCNVISTDRGSARDYLGDGAWYVSPDDPESIRRAVSEAMAAPRGVKGAAADVVRRYAWAAIADQLLTYYREVAGAQ